MSDEISYRDDFVEKVKTIQELRDVYYRNKNDLCNDGLQGENTLGTMAAILTVPYLFGTRLLSEDDLMVFAPLVDNIVMGDHITGLLEYSKDGE